MKKLVIMFVFCLFSLVSYSQVITVYENAIKCEATNYDSIDLKIDSIKAIIKTNPSINYVNFFESGDFRKSVKTSDIIKMDENTILKNIKKKRPKYFYKNKITTKYRGRYIIPNRTTSSGGTPYSIYKDYRTGYTIETYINDNGGYAIMKDSSGKNNKYCKNELVVNYPQAKDLWTFFVKTI